MATGTITSDSVPVYCWFGGSDCWSCDDLITWHQQLVVALGQQNANQKFIDSFTNDTPVICEQLDCRSFNSNFRTYFSQQGILSDLYTGIGVLAQPIGFATGIVTNAGNAVSSVANSAGKTAASAFKVAQYVVPAIVIAISIGIIIYIVKQVKAA